MEKIEFDFEWGDEGFVEKDEVLDFDNSDKDDSLSDYEDDEFHDFNLPFSRSPLTDL
jgi:hypothetical protein